MMSKTISNYNSVFFHDELYDDCKMYTVCLNTTESNSMDNYGPKLIFSTAYRKGEMGNVKSVINQIVYH